MRERLPRTQLRPLAVLSRMRLHQPVETIAGAASVAGDAIVNATGEAAQAAGKVAGAVAEGVSVVGENVASSDA